MPKKMCVVGAGTMGWGIAQVFAAAGWAVMLCDREHALAQKGKDAMAASLQKRVQKGKLSAADAEAILARITPALPEECAGCTLAVEAIYEDMDAKKATFKTLEQVLPPEALLCSNTSSLSITELANSLQDPGRMAGMHFFNPAPVMALVEVIGGANTREETVAAVMRIAEEVGKTPVRVEESAGFVVNRVLVPMINEAVCVYADGVASAEDVDTALRLGANHPIGPLALGDLVGLDVCLSIMEVLHAETGEDKYRPHPLLRKMVRAGHLGRKTGQGFFCYEG